MGAEIAGVSVGTVVGVTLVAGVVIAYWRTGRSAYESAPYTVVNKDGNFEIRDYPKMTIIETVDRRGRDNGFRKLFKFITGTNGKQQKIAMTTPVYMH